MSSKKEFVEYIVSQIQNAGRVGFRAMFGEYAIYCNEKVVALVCDDQVFVKATEAGRAYIKSPTEAAPYPGAKLSFLIQDQLDDSQWLTELIRITAKELPEP